MIIKFAVSNFHSIGEEQELNFAINPRDMLDNSSCTVNGWHLNKVSALMGANASGKTNMLKAMTFLLYFSQNSYTENHIINSFSFHQLHYDLKNAQPTKPLIFKVQYVMNNTEYFYELHINRKKIDDNFITFVEYESLKFKKERLNNVIFECKRGVNGNYIKFANDLKVNKHDEARIYDKLRSVSILSFLKNTGYPITFYPYISNVNYAGKMETNFDYCNTYLQQNMQNKKTFLPFLKVIDQQINDIFIDKINGKETIIIDKGKFLTFFDWESNGTHKALHYFQHIDLILRAGGACIFDEIEDGVHVNLLLKMIELFENPTTNPHNAQLIYSTHNPILLRNRTKTQIFLCEKPEYESEYYRLDAVRGVRNTENFAELYLTGRYGAVASNQPIRPVA